VYGPQYCEAAIVSNDQFRNRADAPIEVKQTPFGLHWDALDEDISVAGLLAGRGEMHGVGRVA
jgi:hypothetical protein